MPRIFALRRSGASVKDWVRQTPVMESLEERLQLSTVTPASVTLGYGSTLYLTKTQTVPLSITLPPSSVTNKVDIALLLDGTGSFNNLAAKWKTSSATSFTSLQAALPGVDLGFGVARFKDYGGPFSPITTELQTRRPFILDSADRHGRNGGGCGDERQYADEASALAATDRVRGRHSGAGHRGAVPDCHRRRIQRQRKRVQARRVDRPGRVATTAVNPGTSGDVPPFSSNVGTDLRLAGWDRLAAGCGAHRDPGHRYRSRGVVRGTSPSRPRSLASGACP